MFLNMAPNLSHTFESHNHSPPLPHSTFYYCGPREVVGGHPFFKKLDWQPS